MIQTLFLLNTHVFNNFLRPAFLSTYAFTKRESKMLNKASVMFPKTEQKSS